MFAHVWSTMNLLKGEFNEIVNKILFQGN